MRGKDTIWHNYFDDDEVFNSYIKFLENEISLSHTLVNTNHSIERSKQRGINYKKINDCLKNGYVVEVSNKEEKENGITFHYEKYDKETEQYINVVIGFTKIKQGDLQVITTYLEKESKFKDRKTKNKKNNDIIKDASKKIQKIEYINHYRIQNIKHK